MDRIDPLPVQPPVSTATDREILGAILELLQALAFRLTGEEPRVPMTYTDSVTRQHQGSDRISWHSPATPPPA